MDMFGMDSIMQKYGMPRPAAPRAFNPAEMGLGNAGTFKPVGTTLSGLSSMMQDQQKTSALQNQQSANARQALIGQLTPRMMAGRPPATPTGMGMTPPSRQVFNPMLQGLTQAGSFGQGGGIPFARQNADGIMRKYGMMR